MILTAVDYIRNVDTFAAIDYLLQQDDPFAVTTSFNDVIGHLYWEDKDLANVIAIGRAGMQYGLSKTAETEDINPEAADKIRLKVRALAFNVASYAWPGWDEEGITPNNTDVAFGYDAAKLLVRLVEEMEAEPVKMARAWWMLGVYQLAAGKNDRARNSFNLSADFAGKAFAKSEQLLAEAFRILADAQEEPGIEGLSDQLESVKASLALEEHGADFANQVDTAARVFAIKL